MTLVEKLRENLTLAQEKAQPYLSQAQQQAGAAYGAVHDRIAGSKTSGGMHHAESASDVTVSIPFWYSFSRHTVPTSP